MMDLAHFWRHGWVKIDRPWPKGLHGRMLAEMQEWRAKRLDQLASMRRMVNLWEVSQASRELAQLYLPDVRELFLGVREPFILQTLTFEIGTEQPLHADTVHFNSLPHGWMVGVWVALEPIDAENGPLEVLSGSHVLPDLTLGDFAQPGYAPSYAAYEQGIAGLAARLEPMGIRRESILLKEGEAIAWHANLIHGGSPIVDRSRTRWSQVTHYFGEWCRYFTAINVDHPARLIERRFLGEGACRVMR